MTREHIKDEISLTKRLPTRYSLPGKIKYQLKFIKQHVILTQKPIVERSDIGDCGAWLGAVRTSLNTTPSLTNERTNTTITNTVATHH